MKKLLVFTLVIVFVLSMSVTSAFAFMGTEVVVTPGEDTAQVNGEDVTLDVAAKIINDRTMIPIRFVAEELGFAVDWDGDSRTVYLGENKEVVLPIGATAATVNGVSVALDSPAIIENGRTLVPLRFVSESLGATVDWNAEERYATISYSPQLAKAAEIYGQPVEGEAEVLAALDYEFAYDFATKLASFGDAKDGRGFHLIGSTAGKAAADYAYDTFKEIGLSPVYHEVPATGWEYYGSSIEIKGHEDLDYFITSAPGTPPTPKEGITGELVYVGTATKEELDGLDLTGKIALAEFDWDYTIWMNNIEHAVANHGAAGLIYFCTNGYGTDESGMAEFVGDWSGVAATIPTWSMRQVDGFKLAALAENETLTVTAYSDCKIIPDATGYNVLATIKGAVYPDEYIVINAHTDAYFHCLQDDSAPVGIMMAMAKAMVDTGYKPDRSIVFVTTDGEECGGGDTFYDWLVGAWALVNDKVNEWGGKIVDAHTIEMIGDNKSTNFGYRVSDVMYLFALGMADGMNASGDYENFVEVDNYMTTSSDEWAFSYFGYPTTRTIMENAADEVYHSSMDTPDRFSYANFVEHVNAQTTMILRIDKQTFAPYDLARDAELYALSLDPELLGAQKLDVDAMGTALHAYLDSAWKLIDMNMEMEELYKAAAADADSAAKLTKVNTMIASYNKAMRATAETIIQGTQYVALDIPVNQIEYYQHIPGAFDAAIATLKAGEPDGLLDALYAIDVEGLDQYPIWYTECLEYETWVNSYCEALEADKPGADYKWVSGILLQYYDVYAVMESVNAKVEAGNADFTAEINELTKMKLDVEKKLKDGFATDLQMWKTALSQLPVKQAEAILEELR